MVVQIENVPVEKSMDRHKSVRHDEWHKRVIESMCLAQQAISCHRNHIVQWAECSFWRAEKRMVQCEVFLFDSEIDTIDHILMNVKQSFQ